MKEYFIYEIPNGTGTTVVYKKTEVDAEIAELRKEITLLKVERDNANQHNSIMRQEAMERKRGIADMIEILESCKDAVDPYLVDCRKLDKLIINIKRRGDMKRYKADIAPHWSKQASAVPVYLADEVDAEIAELVEMLEQCSLAVDRWTVDANKLEALINKHKKN